MADRVLFIQHLNIQVWSFRFQLVKKIQTTVIYWPLTPVNFWCGVESFLSLLYIHVIYSLKSIMTFFICYGMQIYLR